MTVARRSSSFREAAFWSAALLCLAPLLPLPGGVVSLVAPGALFLGAALALTLGNPRPGATKAGARWLLQGSVVLLGFSMDVGKVAQAGRSGLVFSLASIAAVFALGGLLGRALRIRAATGLLVSAGTAICGGSAIAAVSSVVEAPEEDVSVSVGVVFLLNALALLLFPPLGRLLGLTPYQFGVWSGISIHDVASVVGAGAAYGPAALEEATAVKLARVLYLVPVSLIAAWLHHRRTGGKRRTVQVPWFVGLFLLATVAHGFVPAFAAHADEAKRLAAAGFALALFGIGAALTRDVLKRVGLRPLLLGSVLWISISLASLLAVLWN